MSAYIFDYDASLDLVLDESVITLARLKAYPFTAPLAVDFEGFLASLTDVSAEDIQIRIALLSAQAVSFVLDADLNDLSDATSKILDVVVNEQAQRSRVPVLLRGPAPE